MMVWHHDLLYNRYIMMYYVVTECMHMWSNDDIPWHAHIVVTRGYDYMTWWYHDMTILWWCRMHHTMWCLLYNIYHYMISHDDIIMLMVPLWTIYGPYYEVGMYTILCSIHMNMYHKHPVWCFVHNVYTIICVPNDDIMCACINMCTQHYYSCICIYSSPRRCNACIQYAPYYGHIMIVLCH